MEVFTKRKGLLFGGLGVVALLGFWITGQSPETFLFTLSMLPMVGMALGNGAGVGLEDLPSSFSMEGNGSPRASTSAGPPSPAWLFWLKAFGDLTMKVFLGIFHLSILAGAMPFSQPFEELTGIGDAFYAVGMGSWNLGTIMAVALTLVFLFTPPGGWYIYLTRYDGPQFWKRESPDRLIPRVYSYFVYRAFGDGAGNSRTKHCRCDCARYGAIWGLTG